MIPLFKSHYSIGKSILTLERESKEGGADSIFSILKENKMKELFLVEDSFRGFYEAEKICNDLKIALRFGLRIDYKSTNSEDEDSSKIVIFAKNGNGVKSLVKISSEAKGGEPWCATTSMLKKYWNNDQLILAIPFYDSFLYNNVMTLKSCIVDFDFTKPILIREDNGLPMDFIIKESVESYAKSEGVEILDAKSIFYKNKEDVEAFQAYKCITSRKFGAKTLAKPNLDHFGSNEFCFESWKEKNVGR